MSDTMESAFTVNSIQHRVLGQQIRLQLADDYVLRFTPAEASSLSLALVAVRHGISAEREIYMSPIASDDAFVGTVQDAGMHIAAGSQGITLEWRAVERLAIALAKAIG